MMAAPIQRDNAPALSDTAASKDESPGFAAAMSPKIIPLVDEPAATIGSLTARMSGRDEQAFNTFHDLYCDRLFRYLIVLCRGDEELSRDLLQITMLKVVRSIRHFSDETAFWNWLAAIARNNFLDFVRKAGRRPQFEPILETANLPASTNNEDRILVAALETALQQLPNDERTLIEAFYFESGSYASLASQCDASPKAVESRLTRVRQKLRHAIMKQLRYENS